ncbi:MAG: hypothetical protein WBB34_00135 [Xanthobacteraceae bacterium]
MRRLIFVVLRVPRSFLLICGLSPCLSVSCGHTQAVTAESGAVAFIEQVIPKGTNLVEVANIRHSGVDVEIHDNLMPLSSGDEIFMKRSDVVLVIRMLATNKIMLVRKSVAGSATKLPDFSVPRSSVEPLSGFTATWLISMIGGADESAGGSTLAASREGKAEHCYNESGRTNEPIPFQIPILRADRSLLYSGKRSLFVSWRGGSPPFSVTLLNARTGQVVIEKSGIRDTCAAYLQNIYLRPGRYQLSVMDVNGIKEQEDNLFVTNDQPPVPHQLEAAQLSDEARSIYTATWLTVVDGGRWAFEAQQRVASVGCKSAAAEEWLRQWGGTLPCRD